MGAATKHIIPLRIVVRLPLLQPKGTQITNIGRLRRRKQIDARLLVSRCEFFETHKNLVFKCHRNVGDARDAMSLSFSLKSIAS